MTSPGSKIRDNQAPQRPPPHRAAGGGSPKTQKRRENPAGGLWSKAQVAARSARMLAESGDLDGAVNRNYYAVFGAARASLARVRASLAQSKGHDTIIRRFDKHLVKERGFDPSLGWPFFGRLRHARWAADYDAARVDEAAARAIIGEMDRFLAAAEPFLGKVKR